MSSRKEEIREGIDRDIEFVLMAAYHAGKTGESISETIDKCKSHLKEALHSQGVVIKVERELPEFPGMPSEVLMVMPDGLAIKMCEWIKNARAGYVAVRSLIEELNGNKDKD